MEPVELPLVLTIKRGKFVSSTKYKIWKPIFINHKSISSFVHITSQKRAWKYKKKKLKTHLLQYFMLSIEQKVGNQVYTVLW